LMAAKPKICGPTRSAFLQKWILPMLGRSTA
jgi:hypothetical protein